MKEEPYQQDSKNFKSQSLRSNTHHRRRSPSRRDTGERRRSSRNSEDKHFNNGDRDEPSRRLSQYNEGLSTRESPSLKFQWNRLLFQSDPSKLSVDSNQSSYHSTQYGFSSTRVTTEGENQSNRYLDISANTEQARTYSLNPNAVGVSNDSVNLDYRFTLPSSNLNVPSNEYRLSTEKSEMITTPLRFDVYDRKSRIKSHDLGVDDVRDYSRPNFSPTERKQGGYTNIEGQRNVRDDIESLCEEHGYRYLSRTSIMDHTVDRIDECSRREYSRDSTKEQYKEDLGYEGDLYEDHLSHEEDSEMLLTEEYEYDKCLGGINASTQEHRLNEPYRTLLKPKRGIEKKSTRHKSLSNKISSTCSDIKNRLGPCPQKVNITVTLPWLKNSNSSKLGRKVQDSVAENSEEFKQMVNSAFLRYFKQLNENSAQWRSFKERGKAGLKCSICGSNSKEFVDCKSLTAHAFASPKVGLRTQHLGFHKALCVLMGWKSGMDPNKSWVYEKLSDAEALALKEDLIIWPPAVIIHNSSIQNKNPDQRVIVSIEALDTMLKDMGYGGKAKMCRGKTANHSIMVVKFNGTFSGLQEAERLHKFYSETKHGRAKLQRMESGNTTGCDGEVRNEEANKAEFVLFGYLGQAEDLDKLDFETKKKCFVKSKKEIHDIANATLKD